MLPPPGVDHGPAGELAQVVDGDDVDVEGPLEVVQGLVHRRVRHAVSGVVHQHVERPGDLQRAVRRATRGPIRRSGRPRPPPPGRRGRRPGRPGARSAVRRPPPSPPLRAARGRSGHRGPRTLRSRSPPARRDGTDLSGPAQPRCPPRHRQRRLGLFDVPHPARRRRCAAPRPRTVPAGYSRPSARGWARVEGVEHEVRDLLRAPATAAVDRAERGGPHPRRARPGRARRPVGHRLRVGGRTPLPRGVLALVRTRGVPRSVQPADDATCGSATASCSPRRSSTTRPASPNASRCSTWCPVVGSTSARASRRPRPSWVGSASTTTASGTPGWRASRRRSGA